MRRISIFAITVILAVAFLFSSQAFGQSAGKVLMIPREGYSSDLDLMIKMEVGVITKLLKNAGFEVDIATTSGQRILGCTQKIEKVMRLSEVNMDNYVGIIMPCMGVGAFPGPPVSQEAVALVKKALRDGKPVAATSNAGTVLAEAGVLKGKKYAFVKDPLKTSERYKRTDSRFEGAIYGGQGVIQDGKIITSGICPNLEVEIGMPNQTVTLTKTFIGAIGSK